MRRLFLIALVALAACTTAPTEEPILPTLAPTFPPPPQPVVVGSTVTGELTETDPQNEYRFSAAAGDRIGLEVFAGAIGFTLLNDNREIIAPGIVRETTLPAAGEYILQVTGNVGAYEFRITEIVPTPAVTETDIPVLVGTAAPPPRPHPQRGTFQTTISSANPAFGAFNTPDEKHIYTFQGAAGSFVRLRMRRTSGEVDPLLTLYTEDGTAIATDDNGGGGRTALINGVQLPEAGVYGVVASGEGLSGTYELTLETATEDFPVTPVVDGSERAASIDPTEAVVLTPTVSRAVTGALLFDHAPQQGTIERPGGFDRYSIAASAGEVFSVGIVPDVGLEVRVDLIAPSGADVAEIERPEADGELLVTNFTAETTGTYIVFVTSINDTVGSYLVSYGRGSTREEIRQGETFTDRSYTGQITRRAVRDVWFLRLSAGDLITADVTATPGGTLRPFVEFVAPDGAVLFATGTPPGEDTVRIITARAPVDGIYTLRVRGEIPTQTGAYTLIWRYIEAAPTATPPLLVSDLFVVDDVLPASEFLYYPFQGTAGERVLIEVTAVTGSGLDAVVSLLNEDGEPFAEDDDSGGNLNPRLIAQLPADGVYQVRVGGYLSGGGFVLRVRRVY
ncbi:MAG: PPC domain-containing protein [Chloroflexota bacterium]